MARRKWENGAVATQVDLDDLSAKYNLIADKDGELDKWAHPSLILSL